MFVAVVVLAWVTSRLVTWFFHLTGYSFLKVALCNNPTTHLVWYTLTFYT